MTTSKSIEETIKDEANKLYPEVLPMNRGVMSYDELDEHNYQMEDKREAYIAGRSQNLAREKRIMALLEYYFRKSTWVEGEENRERNWEQFKKDSNL